MADACTTMLNFLNSADKYGQKPLCALVWDVSCWKYALDHLQPKA